MSAQRALNSPQAARLQTGSLTEAQRVKLLAVENKEIELRQWLLTRKNFVKEEKDALEWRSYGECVEYWRKLSEDSKGDLDQRRQRGWRKWSHGYQNFGAAVMRFMKDWDPIIGLVRALGGQYGDMAIGTISAVFVIAQAKDAEEGFIASALASIRDRSLGFATYQEIYTNDNVLEEDLRSKIVDAYTSFLSLAIEAIKYYKSRGTWRTFGIIDKPSKFKDMADEVQNSIVSVQLRCGELLNKDVREIKRLNEDLKKQILNLERQVQELQVGNHNKNLAHINHEWNHGRPPQEQHKDLTRYRRILDEELSDSFEQFRIKDEKRRLFEASTEYNQWQSPRHSSVLVLIGYSEPTIEVEQYYCWLSPLVLDLIEQYRKQLDGTTQRDFHAYHLLDVKRDTSLHDVIISILFQLLRFKPQALNEQDHYFNLIKLHQQSHEEPRRLEELAMAVIGFFDPSDTVYILLDRLDRCATSERLMLLDLLAHLTKGASCTLKVLVVVSGSDWSFDLREIPKTYRDVVVRYVERQERTEESNYY